jgi:hypothetical protein
MAAESGLYVKLRHYPGGDEIRHIRCHFYHDHEPSSSTLKLGERRGHRNLQRVMHRCSEQADVAAPRGAHRLEGKPKRFEL